MALISGVDIMAAAGKNAAKDRGIENRQQSARGAGIAPGYFAWPV